MTIGIYRLVFKDTDKCYIGQSVHIEKRFKDHLNSFKTETATTKLMVFLILKYLLNAYQLS